MLIGKITGTVLVQKLFCRSHFVKVDSIAKGVTNNGLYSFQPTQFTRRPLLQVGLDESDDSNQILGRLEAFPLRVRASRLIGHG